MKRRVTAVLLLVTMLLIVAVPASSVTDWSTKASANSRGASYWTTDSLLSVVVNQPYAVRLGFRTTNNRANTVTYSYEVFCENASKTRYDRTVTTRSDNTWVYVTVYSGSNTLGRFCSVTLASELGATNRMYTRIQAKQL